MFLVLCINLIDRATDTRPNILYKKFDFCKKSLLISQSIRHSVHAAQTVAAYTMEARNKNRPLFN